MKWIARTDNNNIWRYQKIHSSRLTADEKDRSAQLTITGKIFGAAFQTFAIMPRCWLGQMTEYIRIDWFCSNFAARDVLYTFGPLFPKVIIDSKRDFNSEEELLEEGCKISACYVACLCSGVRYPIWFNSTFEFCQKMIHSIFDSIVNIALPMIQFKILFNSKKILLIQFKR